MTNDNDTPRVTPGPWKLMGKGESQYIGQTNHITRDVWVIPRSEADLPFIVHAVNAIFALAAHTGRDPASLARWAAEGKNLMRLYEYARKTCDDICDGDPSCPVCQIAKLPAAKEADNG